jgi:ubiquinone/menaquinone biosynthesis C-methylase UbiE
VTEEIAFRSDLYRGTAADYDRFRVGYPQALVNDLATRSRLTGQGRLLDLACGTGQITFATHDHFAEVWAVDQEMDMVELVRTKATAAGVDVRTVASKAEDLDAPDGSFELVAVGNAFHRLRRRSVAQKALRWLEPGRCLALLWSDLPWHGAASWQRAMSATLDTWTTRASADKRTPAGLERARREDPDRTILEETGFELQGFHSFPLEHDWTPEALIGFVYSTSFLPRVVLGELADDFEADLRTTLAPAGPLHQTINFGYELACRPR